MDPLIEQLKVPCCVMVSHLLDTCIKLIVFTCWWEAIQVAHCLYAHARWYLYTSEGLDEQWVILVIQRGHLHALGAYRKIRLLIRAWCGRPRCSRSRFPWRRSRSRETRGHLYLQGVPQMNHQFWWRISTSLELSIGCWRWLLWGSCAVWISLIQYISLWHTWVWG